MSRFAGFIAALIRAAGARRVQCDLRSFNMRGQFNIYYRRGVEQPEYIPDFVAATPDANLLIEAKRAGDMTTEEVTAKTKAAADWCAHATAYSLQYGGKAWRYLLIPHDAVAVNKTLTA